MAPAKIISIFVFVFISWQVKATVSDTLVVIVNRQHLMQGDSIDIEIYTEPYSQNQPAQSLHLWIDNIKTGQRWKFRYPFLRGRYKLALKINDSIPNGLYAFNFLLQNRFLAITGQVLNAKAEDMDINFIATTKNKAPIIDGAELEPGGFFKIDNLFYTDSVYFGFSPSQKSKENKLKIAIETPVDSAFIPASTATEFVTIGLNETEKITEDTVAGSYVFSIADKKDKQLLKEVVVQSKLKKQREKYEKLVLRQKQMILTSEGPAEHSFAG